MPNIDSYLSKFAARHFYETDYKHKRIIRVYMLPLSDFESGIKYDWINK